jgi:hypothetical protein
MATIYRNGTYVAFHAQGTNVPIDTDMKYYNLLKAWSAKKDDAFTFANSHEKTSALRTTSSKDTLKNRLSERLRNYSKQMILLIGNTTKDDTDWVPFEISYAIDYCNIPIIVTYVDVDYGIRDPYELSHLWPPVLKERIENNTASCLHIPFKKASLLDALRFDINNKPLGGGLGIYDDDAYKSFGIRLK